MREESLLFEIDSDEESPGEFISLTSDEFDDRLFKLLLTEAFDPTATKEGLDDVLVGCNDKLSVLSFFVFLDDIF